MIINSSQFVDENLIQVTVSYRLNNKNFQKNMKR